MKVKCIDQDGNGYITIGRSYDAIDSTSKCYEIINDQKQAFMYRKTLFEVVQGQPMQIFKDLTDNEKGALLLAQHNGEAIQCLAYFGQEWVLSSQPCWADDSFYRIIPKPKYKTTTVDTGREMFKYVEIEALNDALELISTLNMTEEDRITFNALVELIK